MKEYKLTVYDDKTEWYNIDGERHREDGPVIERPDGYKAWCFNGKRHREDGPAIEFANGTKAWYLNGEQLSKSEFLKRTQSVEVAVTMDEIAKKFNIPVESLKIKKD